MRRTRLCSAVVILAVVLYGCSSSTTTTSPFPEFPDEASDLEDDSWVSGSSTPVVRRTDFGMVYKFDAVLESGSEVLIAPYPQLELVPSVESGSEVVRGQVIGSLVIDPEVKAELAAGAARSSVDRSRLAQLEALEHTVRSPVSGFLGKSENGDWAVLSTGIDVVVGLTPVQSLRYRSIPFRGTATVETVMGQRAVACEAVWVVGGAIELNSNASPPSEFGGVDEVKADEVHCRLPRRVETAPGLRGVLILESESLADAVVVPSIFIGYDEETDGYYVIVSEDGVERQIPVDVGPTDGVVRVITSDLPVGVELVFPESAG